MITQYFDINNRLIIQAPGTLAPAGSETWVYGDNYNLATYLLANGIFQPIGLNDTLGAMLFQPGGTLPEQDLAIVSAPIVQTDPAGFNYYLTNVNLKTVPLATLVQTPNKPAVCNFHFTFNPADGERFSSSADIAITVNPDPTQGASGATPIPPGYPSNPNVFEQIAHKNLASGYAGLDPNTNLNPNQIPIDTTLHVASGKLSVVGGAGGNPYVAVVTNSFTIPAEGANTPALTLAAIAPDMLPNATVLITDGISFIAGSVATISGTALVVTNNGAPGAVSGTMGANAHVYLGNSAGQVDTTRAGLVSALPTLNPARVFFRGDKSYAQANYPDLTNIPGTFAPAPHGSQHLSSGGDPVALATLAIAGLCPPPDGTTINILGGKLSAVIPAGTQPYVATTAASFVLPAAGSGNAFNITLTAAWADIVAGMSLLITDGTHTCNLYVNSVTGGTTLNVYNLGGGTAAGATVAAAAHVYLAVSEANPAQHGVSHLVGGADPVPLASAAAAGLCPAVDNLTIQVSASKLAAILATASAPGIVQPDGSTITISAGKISAIGIVGQHGCRYRNSANISYPSAGAVQALTFDTSIFDTDSYSASANPIGTTGRITIPTGQAGYYIVGACVEWVITSGQTYGLLAIQINGALNSNIVADQKPFIASPPQAYVMNISTMLHLNAGDYIQLIVQTNVAASLGSVYANLPNFFALRIS
jgi:hypothetical protein